MKKTISTIKIFATCLCASLLICSCNKSEDKSLKIESEIKLDITRIYRHKGVILLNDSIVLTQNCPRIDIKNKDYVIYKQIEDINKPYKLIKKANNDTILIIKDSDSLLYKLLEM
ncbi:hypothetical protein WNY78_08835 [Psychroserpens sp. AS72]|uniref:hypothetical protein n=1 Tax=Psychroserpens sp. AS72 TaxID=3135775 RepID=UPI00317E0271